MKTLNMFGNASIEISIVTFESNSPLIVAITQ